MALTLSSAFGGIRASHFFQGYVINIPVGTYFITGYEIYFRFPPVVCPTVNNNVRVNSSIHPVFVQPSVPILVRANSSSQTGTTPVNPPQKVRENLVWPIVEPPCC